MGVLVVSQVSVFAWTSVGNGTRGTAYGTVYAGDVNNIAMTNYTLTNMDGSGKARIYVPEYGNVYGLSVSRTTTSKKSSASYTFYGFSSTGQHTHYYTEALIY
ncbi:MULTISPECIES: hypothetical protein [unclassified Clostridium]|uniref:hypothetical protein n=1 Tax=unclassified Clostridium TaxID=2614128 RepID=UPI003217E880